MVPPLIDFLYSGDTGDLYSAECAQLFSWLFPSETINFDVLNNLENKDLIVLSITLMLLVQVRNFMHSSKICFDIIKICS
jgi:hypothetical protein